MDQRELAIVRDTKAVALIRSIFKAHGLVAHVTSHGEPNASVIRCVVPLSRHIRFEASFTVEAKEHPLGFAFSASSELTSTLTDPSYLGGDVSKEHYATPKQALKGLLAAFDDEILDAFTFDLEAAREYLREGIAAHRNLTRVRKALNHIARKLQEF